LAVLTILFFLTALIYASIGFGGGSTYNALLAISGTDFRVLPAIALGCNVIVVSGSLWHLSRAGHMQLRIVLPFALTSIPMAWIGGRLILSEQVFLLLLGVTLLFSGIRMLLGALPVATPAIRPSAARRWLVGLPIGGLLGLLAGMVGIGGGVFLAPLLHYLGWGHARNIAASASLFILLNSIAGLAGQLSKLIASGHLDLLYHYVWLVPAVLLGGQIGSRLGAYHLPDNVVRRLTAVLILYVALRLLWRWHFP